MLPKTDLLQDIVNVSASKWPVLCSVGRKILLAHWLTFYMEVRIRPCLIVVAHGAGPGQKFCQTDGPGCVQSLADHILLVHPSRLWWNFINSQCAFVCSFQYINCIKFKSWTTSTDVVFSMKMFFHDICTSLMPVICYCCIAEWIGTWHWQGFNWYCGQGMWCVHTLQYLINHSPAAVMFSQ